MAKGPLHLSATQINSAVLSKIATEIGHAGVAGAGLGKVADFDSYVKTANCSLHGKGDHIKGDGPNNYLKTSVDPANFGDIENVLTNYNTLVSRLATDVAAKIQAGGTREIGG